MLALLVGMLTLPQLAQAQSANDKVSTFTIMAGPQSSALVNAVTSAAETKMPLTTVTAANSTTSAGIMRFCEGMSPNLPAAIVATRELTDAEIEHCMQAGVTDLSKAQLGYLAIMLVQKKSDPILVLSNYDIYRALAKDVATGSQFRPNTVRTWKDVNPNLPATDISFYTTSPELGSRVMFDLEALVAGCRKVREIRLIFGPANRFAKCVNMRSNLVTEINNTTERVEAFKASAPGSIALMTYDAYAQNTSWMRIMPINGFGPTPSNIYSDDYTMAVPVYIYTKKKYSMPNGDLKQRGANLYHWLSEALSARAIGPGGYLEQLGLIPMPTAIRSSQRTDTTNN